MMDGMMVVYSVGFQTVDFSNRSINLRLPISPSKTIAHQIKKLLLPFGHKFISPV